MIKTPGRGLLFVNGILLIIFGAMTVIGSLFFSLALFTIYDFIDTYLGGALTLGILKIIGLSPWGALILCNILSYICALLGIIAGSRGIKYAGVPEKAKQCLILDIGLITVIAVPAIVFLVAVMPIAIMSVTAIIGTGLAVALAVPVLFFTGAILNKRSLTQYKRGVQRQNLRP
jgi:hypothetical protein